VVAGQTQHDLGPVKLQTSHQPRVLQGNGATTRRPYCTPKRVVAPRVAAAVTFWTPMLRKVSHDVIRASIYAF